MAAVFRMLAQDCREAGGTRPWMGEGTRPWMGEGRTMQEQLSGAIAEDRCAWVQGWTEAHSLG